MLQPSRHLPSFSSRRDFLLKRAFTDLFEQFSQLHEGVVESIEVLGGLPSKMVVIETPK